MLWMVVLLTCSLSAPVNAFTECRSSSYQDKYGRCQPCPNHCKSCVSDTSCTVCEDNYWGLTCQMECNQRCPDQCHKEYGHCTYGCPDGTFAQPGFANCTKCSSNCEVCSLASNCIRCRARFYGPFCRRCSNTCVDNLCKGATGECYDCKKGYFIDNGNCQRCPEECASCYDGGKCSTCENGFYGPYTGKCFLECPKSNTTSQFLTSPEDRCGISNGLMSHDTHLCENVSGDQSYTCSTNKYCLTNKPCSSGDSCSINQAADNSAGVCVKIMSEVCFAKCLPSQTAYQDDVNYLCSQTCKVTNIGDDRNGPVCFHDSILDSSIGTTVVNLLSTVHVLCFPGIDSTARSLGDKWNYVWALTIVSSIGLVASCTCVILLIRRCKSKRSSPRKVNQSNKSNDEHVTTEHVATEHVTKDIEVDNIPRLIHPTLQRDAPIDAGKGEGMPTPGSQPTKRRDEYTDETDMVALSNLSTVQHEERVSTDTSAGMTSLMNKPGASREEYTALMVDADVHTYQIIGTRDSYVDCDPIQPTSESAVNSRAATGTSRDYLTPMSTLNTYGNG